MGLLHACQPDTDTVNWLGSFEHNPQKTLEELVEADPNDGELIGIQLLQNFPEQAELICTILQYEELTSHCKRFLSRPHLSTIVPEQAETFWQGGAFDTRPFFPTDFVTAPKTAICAKDEITCIDAQFQLGIEGQNVELLAGSCASFSSQRGQSDCFFRASEAWVKQYGGYRQPVEFCRQSGSYSAECHHHLLLALAIRHQANGAQHAQIIQDFTSYWSDYPSYGAELTELYWSILSARVAGVLQPFRWSEWSFLPKNHLHSAIGLRLIREDDPIQSLQDLLSLPEKRLEKAYGPGTPFFEPRQVWPTASKPTLYFCDIRGGRRPTVNKVTDDNGLALLSAAAMMVPPNKALIQEMTGRFPQLSGYSAYLLDNM